MTSEPPAEPPRAADAVIVGAGAAGSLFAARLAGAGRRVIVLEAGPAWGLGDLVSSQIWARRLKWGGAPVLQDGTHRFGHGFGIGWGFGGSALHHYAGWPRLHPQDLRTRTLYGRGLDWPIDYETLRPHYDRIQKEMGVSGDAEAEVWRPPGEPYPMPPLKVYRQGELLAAGFRKLGMRVAPAPLAINSVVYAGRAACIDDGWCDAGCPIGALANPLIAHVPLAQERGARFIAHATVSRVLTDARGRASGVEYFDAGGERRTLAAPLVLLCGAAIQNARLLLASASAQHPRGLGNGSGLVGRYFHCHTIATVYALFDEPTEPHMGVPAGSLMCQDGYRKDGRPGAFGSYQWGIGQAVKPNDLLGIANTRVELHGAKLHQFMRRAARSIAVMAAVCETLPEADNRIELAEARDRFGAPLPKIVHTLQADALALWEHANREGIAVAKAAGALEAWHGPMATTHASGGTIMGTDPQRSVCDSYGRLHEVDNVYVAGGGLFPTIGAGSPTFTLYALADRAAGHILDRWRDFARRPAGHA